MARIAKSTYNRQGGGYRDMPGFAVSARRNEDSQLDVKQQPRADQPLQLMGEILKSAHVARQTLSRGGFLYQLPGQRYEVCKSDYDLDRVCSLLQEGNRVVFKPL